MNKKGFVFASLVLAALMGSVSLVLAMPSPWRTIVSLRRVDDYPLYAMRYYGDYGFADFLRRGIRRSGSSTLAPIDSWACTTYAALGPGGNRILGRNFDWHNRQTLLLFTDPPDGYASASMVDLSYLGFPAQNPSWADRAKLLDAPYLPFDGLNERGLAVGMMAVPRARDSSDPQKVTIGSLHAIRLMLDYAKDMSEAVALLQAYTVDFGGGPPIHYLVADASGDSAVIEYLDGKMTVLRSEEPWQVSTNFIIAEQSPKDAESSCWRYNKAYETLKGAEGTFSSAEAMALLQDVSQSSTMWSVVYNLTDGGIQVAMGREYDRVHTFRLRLEDK